MTEEGASTRRPEMSGWTTESNDWVTGWTVSWMAGIRDGWKEE